MSTPISRILGAGTPAGQVDLGIDGGLVSAVSDPSPIGPETVLDAAGAVVMPAFVDAHVHLDKAPLHGAGGLEVTGPGVGPAITLMQEVRRTQPAGIVEAGARQGVESLVRHGVVAARAHVEVDADTRLDMLDLHIALREENAQRIDLQLSVFPQNGLSHEVTALMAAALRHGGGVVGGCPYVDDDQEAHLDVVFGLAERFGLPVDLHLDFDDDPSGSMVAAVAERTRALGMQGQVTIGHVTKLAAMPVDEQEMAYALMAGAGISLVVMPATDLYLGGSGEPGSRSLAPLERAHAAGVRVAVSNNNLHNAFSPYGNGNLLQAAWTAGLTRQLVGPEMLELLVASITDHPARILGRAPHGTTVGDVADLVVLDADDPRLVALQVPAVLASIRSGTLVHRQRSIRTQTMEVTS